MGCRRRRMDEVVGGDVVDVVGVDAVDLCDAGRGDVGADDDLPKAGGNI